MAIYMAMATNIAQPAPGIAPSCTIESFPAQRLVAARNQIEKGWQRLVRAAAKVGQPAPACPRIVVREERAILRCGTCNRFGGDADGWLRAPEGSLARQWGSTPPCDPLGWGADAGRPGCRGTMRPHVVIDLDVFTDAAKLAGWDFLAVVEPLTGGNLIRNVPGARVADGELEPYRTGDIACDHCAKKRRRAETFVVRSDGSVPGVDAGASDRDQPGRPLYRQVGRTCLRDFLGGKDAASILWLLSIEREIREVGDDDGEGWGADSTDRSLDMLEFLTWTAASIRIVGWTSKAEADARGTSSTSSRALYLITPQGVGFAGQWNEARRAHQWTEADVARAGAVLSWAKGLPESSDYERNLKLVASQPRLYSKHAGILASAIPAFDRETGRAIERAARAQGQPGSSEHVGEVGKRSDYELVIERIADVETDYGMLHIHTMRDASGNAVVWKTTSKRLEVHTRIKARGTVKRHAEYKGEKQTELSRVNVLEEEQAPIDPARLSSASRVAS